MFPIQGEINAKVLRRLARYAQVHHGEHLHVYIDSHGGCIRSALAMHEILRTCANSGKNIIMQGVDEIFSAALIVYLAGDLRYATRYTQFMIHEVTLEDLEGENVSARKAKFTAEDLENETLIYYNLIKSRCKLPLGTIRRKVKNALEGDWFFDIDEATRYQIVTHPGFYIKPTS